MGRTLAATVFACVLALSALGGCARQGAPAPETLAESPAVAGADATPPVVDAAPGTDASGLPGGQAPGVVDYACTTDADCAIKDVGNCCGYYPACVNSDSPTFPEQVKAQCAERGMSSICGFPALSGCQCVDNRCEGVSAGQGEPTGRID